MDADPRLVRLEFRPRQKAHVIGRENRHASLLRQFQDCVRVDLLVYPPGALDLEVEPIAA